MGFEFFSGGFLITDLKGIPINLISDRTIYFLNLRFFAAKTKSAVLIAIYEGEAAAGADVRGAIESLAKFLEEAGY